jgi:hypothetical protein
MHRDNNIIKCPKVQILPESGPLTEAAKYHNIGQADHAS